MRIECKYDELMKLEEVEKKVHPDNENAHPEEQIRSLTKVIAKIGVRHPIHISKRSGLICGGHGRLMAFRKLGYTDLPIVWENFESELEEVNYRASDNIGQYAEFNQNKYVDNLKKLDVGDLKQIDFEEYGLVGFKLPELETIPLVDPNHVPSLPKEPVTKKGDVWLLNGHRLMCGDSTMIDCVERLFKGIKPNVMVTDPPYGVEYEAGWRAEAKDVKKTEREETSNIQNDARADWYDAYVLFPGNVAYVWHASSKTDIVKHGLEKANFGIIAQIIWNKNVHALSRGDYHWKHEPCWYAVRNGCAHSWEGDRKQMTVWNIDNVMFEKDAGGKTSHPTQKPVVIYENAIVNHTKEGDYIYDPFCGSGSAVIACEKKRRKALCMELDEKFCDVIIKRWQEYSGFEARLESTGQTFNELKK